MKRLYKVSGFDEYNKDYYSLGYTNSKAAWLRNRNGWKKKNLIFTPIIGKDEAIARDRKLGYC